jgi:hypothetical protein
LALDQIFRSTEKSQKIRSTENETFDQLKKDNFDQVKFDQMSDSRLFVLQSKLFGNNEFFKLNVNATFRNLQHSLTFLEQIIWRLGTLFIEDHI